MLTDYGSFHLNLVINLKRAAATALKQTASKLVAEGSAS
jgi:hypothetical protein